MKTMFHAALVAAFAAASPAMAESLDISAVMVPQEQIKLDFEDGSRRFLLMVRREGTAEGTGLLDGASVTEFGAHDIAPGIGGDPQGYLVLRMEDGAVAYLKWRVRAVFVPGPDGKPMLLDNGVWEVVGSTGRLDGLQGAGTMHIKAVNPTDRRFILKGDLFLPAG